MVSLSIALTMLGCVPLVFEIDKEINRKDLTKDRIRTLSVGESTRETIINDFGSPTISANQGKFALYQLDAAYVALVGLPNDPEYSFCTVLLLEFDPNGILVRYHVKKNIENHLSYFVEWSGSDNFSPDSP